MIAVTPQWSVHYIMAARVRWCKCCFCVQWGSLLPIHRQFVRPAVEAPTEVCGTAGAPPWLIKVVARTSSPPEWRQRPHNGEPVCYACPLLSGDCRLALALSWGSRGAKREVRTKDIYYFMTKASFVAILWVIYCSGGDLSKVKLEGISVVCLGHLQYLWNTRMWDSDTIWKGKVLGFNIFIAANWNKWILTQWRRLTDA